MTKNCFTCRKELSDGAHCTVCNQDFHYWCASITEIGYRRLGERKNIWSCPKCKQGGQPSSQMPSGSTGHSSLAVTPVSSPQPKPDCDSQVLIEIRSIAAKLVPLETLADEVKALRTELSDMRSSVNEASKFIKEFNLKIENLDSRLTHVEKLQEQQKVLQDKIDHIENDMMAKEQWARMNNVEIKGVPQADKENLYGIVESLGRVIQYSVPKSLINFVTRVPTRDATLPKPIIVCFNNRYAKDDFVAAARGKAKEMFLSKSAITASDLGMKGTNRIYVNDHLTPRIKDLLNKARKAASEHSFRFIWVKNATIHVRKDTTTPVFFIRNERDISKIV